MLDACSFEIVEYGKHDKQQVQSAVVPSMLQQHEHQQYSSLTKDSVHDLVFMRIKTQEHKQMRMLSATTKPLGQRYGKHRETGWESGEAARYRPRTTRTRDMGAKFLVTVSSPPSPTCGQCAPLAQLECSAENHR